jgi:hypothetical protein
MNPCPCGYLGQASGRCQCTPEQIARYVGKLSGPLLDRIDMHVQVPALNAGELTSAVAGETTEQVRQRVQQARDRSCSARDAVMPVCPGLRWNNMPLRTLPHWLYWRGRLRSWDCLPEVITGYYASDVRWRIWNKV